MDKRIDLVRIQIYYRTCQLLSFLGKRLKNSGFPPKMWFPSLGTIFLLQAWWSV